jgi:hypothetical protein
MLLAGKNISPVKPTSSQTAIDWARLLEEGH